MTTVEGGAMPKPLPPDPDNQNEDRAVWAITAINAFRKATRTELEDALSDLLCDLMHLADRREAFLGRPDDPESMLEEFEAALDRARRHYEDETTEEDESLEA